MTTQTIAIAANADDNYWAFFGLAWNGDSLVTLGSISGANSHAWLRFLLTASVAQSSTVSAATLTISGEGSGQNAGFSCIAKFNAATNPSNPATHTDAEALSLVSGSGSTIDESPDWPDTTATHVLDITQAMQDLVDDRALTSGDYVLLTLRNNSSLANTKLRQIKAKDQSPAQLPTLEFTYTAGGGGGTSKNLTLLGVG